MIAIRIGGEEKTREKKLKLEMINENGNIGIGYMIDSIEFRGFIMMIYH